VHGLQPYAIPTSTSWIPFTCKSSKWTHKMLETQLNHHLISFHVRAARGPLVCQLRHKKRTCILHACNGNQPPIKQQTWILSNHPPIVCMHLVHTSCLHTMKRCVVLLAQQLERSMSRVVRCCELDCDPGFERGCWTCTTLPDIRQWRQAMIPLI
jgi:hypothetical protein